MAKTKDDKYGVEQTADINIKNNTESTITLNSIEGETVISGILIDKIN